MHRHPSNQLRAVLIVSWLSSSSLASAAAILAGILLPTRSLSRAFDTSMIPSSDGQRDSCTYRLYGSHWLGTALPSMFVVLVPRSSNATRFSVLPWTL